jgi:hypothetical protein
LPITGIFSQPPNLKSEEVGAHLTRARKKAQKIDESCAGIAAIIGRRLTCAFGRFPNSDK